MQLLSPTAVELKPFDFHEHVHTLERYVKGDCHFLAAAIYEITGWATYSFLNGRNEPDFHVFTVTPGGYAFDIEGLHTPEQLHHRWKGRGVSGCAPIDPVHCVSTWTCFDINRKTFRRRFGQSRRAYELAIREQALERARVVAAELVAQHFPGVSFA